ncbi:MAG: hypothetical protein ACOH2J_16685 [Allorhizobium sp.]
MTFETGSRKWAARAGCVLLDKVIILSMHPCVPIKCLGKILVMRKDEKNFMSDMAIFFAMPDISASELLDANGAAPVHARLAQVERVDVAEAVAARKSVLLTLGQDEAALDQAAGEGDDYRRATRLDRQGDMREAAGVLARMTGLPGGEADACLGLAVFALRIGDHSSARVLAARCLDLGSRHPRACSIMGMTALLAGNGSAAQTYLAAAARIARIDSRFSDDLRGAQRVLLKMRVG